MVAGPGLAVVALHRLGSLPWLQVTWSALPAWIGRATLEEAIATALRLIALAAAYWLTSSTALYMVASFTRVPTLVRAAGIITLPLARRMVDRMVVATIALSSMAAPMAAISLPGDTTSPPTVIPPQQVAPTEISTTSPAPELTRLPTRSPAIVIEPVSRTAQATASDSLRARVVVAPGDNLWTLSARHLHRVTGRSPTDAETLRYWRRVIDVNVVRLRSGDPDLIYPGEEFVMPEL